MLEIFQIFFFQKAAITHIYLLFLTYLQSVSSVSLEELVQPPISPVRRGRGQKESSLQILALLVWKNLTIYKAKNIKLLERNKVLCSSSVQTLEY